jgi:hypothetical protein
MTHGRRVAALLVVLALGVVPPARLYGANVEGVQFALRYTAHDQNLVLNCAALLRYMIFIKAYVAGLYLGEAVEADEVLSDVPKRLEIEYFHAIQAKDFAMATDQGIAANVDAETLGELRARIDRLKALYEDVKPGDRYSLTYVPGIGTELALNGQPKGVIEGADFAAAVFGIWLGPQPLDARLKADLLSCA